jgi:hypothetical protein
MIDVEDIQDHDDLYWTCNLRGMLGMMDQIMRFYGNDEELFRSRIADFMWNVVQKNLDQDTEARHEDEFERCGTFPKYPGEPGISHLIAEYMPRHHPGEKYWREDRES